MTPFRFAPGGLPLLVSIPHVGTEIPDGIARRMTDAALARPDLADGLRAELKKLVEAERPEVVRTVAWAAKNGDRSENGDYLYGKRRLREIDRRVRFLRERLDGMRVVSEPPSDRGRVYFGAWVTIEDATGASRRHRIVGPDEFDREPGYISMDAPLGRALLGRRVDDEVEVALPAGRQRFTVLAIEYQ